MAKAKAKPEASKAEAGSLEEMRARYEKATEYWSPKFDDMRADIRFVTVPGNQWDEELKRRRGNRRCYEFPKLRGQVLQIINEMRQTRPQGKVRGVEDGDRGLAELMQGIARNIEDVSHAEDAYDIAGDSQVKGGFGCWRICTDYLRDDDFEQDIRIKAVPNPFGVKLDPAAVELDRRDGLFAFVEELLPKSEFERLHPDADLTDFFEDRHTVNWHDKGQVRVAEYWYKMPAKRTLIRLSDGRVLYQDELGADEQAVANALAAMNTGQDGQPSPNPLTITHAREVDTHTVCMRLTNGAQWLSEVYKFPSKFIPIVPVWGNINNIDGDDYISGAVRFGKDQQRLHNSHRTAAIEAVAKAPKAPFIVKKSWIEGNEAQWRNANAEDYPYLVVNDDASGLPQRANQAEVPMALIQLGQMDNDDMKAATGIYDASLGARSNETSGRAINARKLQGATASFQYVDNMAKAVRFTYEILIDLIPKVYDTQRVVSVLGEDGGRQWKTLYQEIPHPETGAPVVVNDIRKGKYDTSVTVGPSFATQRMEAAQAFADMAGQIGGSAPMLGPLLAYGVIKNQDLPGMEEVDSAMRKFLVGQGILPPKEGEEAPQPPQPDPKMVADVRKTEADAKYSEARALEAMGKAQMTPAQMQKLIAETVQIQLQNLMAGGQMFGPPPDQFGQYDAAPQGAFFSPDGFDPQGPQFTG